MKLLTKLVGKCGVCLRKQYNMYGKIIKEAKTKEGSIITTRTPICAGMEYQNGKIHNYKMREIGYYDTKIYVDKLGATYKEEKGKRVFTY